MRVLDDTAGHDGIIIEAACRQSILCVIQHQVDGSQVIDLFLEVSDAFGVNAVTFVAQVSVNVVAGNDDYFEALVEEILLVAVDLNVGVSFEAIHPALRVSLDFSNDIFCTFAGRLKLAPVLFRALVVGQNTLELLPILDAVSAHEVFDVPWVVFHFPR